RRWRRCWAAAPARSGSPRPGRTLGCGRCWPRKEGAMTPDDPELAARLDAYLDALARGERAHDLGLAPGLVEAAHRFRALDDVPGPNRAFVSHLREDLMHAAIPTDSRIPDLGLRPPPDDHVVTQPGRRPVLRRPQTGRWTLDQLA